MQRRVAGVASRLYLKLDRYPAEALESMCHSVRGDEVDGRHAEVPLAGVAVASRRRIVTVVWRCTACAPCVWRRYAHGALSICYDYVKTKPAVPLAPEAARRILVAMVAAVRALR